MPLPVLSVAQMRQWEQASWDAGRSEAAVIARVGACLAAWLRRHARRRDRILVVAGKGHNGDDARAALPHLQDRTVRLVEVRDPDAALPALERALDERPDWILDGLFGIGLNRPLAEPWCRLIERLNASPARIVAVDVPSGLDADRGEPWGAAVRAAVTLTLGAPKRGLLNASATVWTGRLEVIPDIGLIPCPLESELQWTLPGDFALWPPPRPVAGHKGSFGHLAIVAGSTGYHGAAVLAARAAQRARPGLVTLITPASVYLAAAAQLQAVMVHPWSAAHPLPGKYTALLFGPGLAGADVTPEIRDTFVRLWRHAPVPIVADASALDWLPAGPVPKNTLRILTPHPGEAARLLGTSPAQVQANRPATLRALSEKFGGAWVVLKGFQTLVGRSQGPVFVNPSGNQDLAQGGSGDVLAGYLAGWCAQPELQKDEALLIRYAVWQHGATADRLSRRHSAWVVEDLVCGLGRARPYRASADAGSGNPLSETPVT